MSGPGAEKVGAGDTARAETELPLSPAELSAFLTDSERLFRLNPHLAIERWECLDSGFRFAALNESNGFHIDTTIYVGHAEHELTLHYAEGLKQETRFAVEPAPEGVRLVVTERYPRIEDAQDPRVAEVDRSLVPWVAAIRRHLLAGQRWGWLPGWHWWHERFLPGMAPRQRRIVRLIIWTGIVEFAVFLGLVAVLRYAG